MIPSPPSPSTIISGIAHALRMAVLKGHPEQLDPTPKAIWDSLWLRFMLLTATGTLVLSSDQISLVPLLAVVALVDTLSYPVVSQITLNHIGMAGRFPLFILSVTWIGNLRVILMMVILMIAGGIQTSGGTLLIVATAFWLLWATWSVAALSLGGRGWLGAGMVVLMMFVELTNALIFDAFVHPLVGAFSQ